MCDFAKKFSELLNLDSGFYDIILLRLLLVKQKKVFSLQKVENDSYTFCMQFGVKHVIQSRTLL